MHGLVARNGEVSSSQQTYPENLKRSNVQSNSTVAEHCFVHLFMRQEDCRPSVMSVSKSYIRMTTKCSAHISRVFAVRRKIYNRSSFKKSALRDGMSLLQKSLRFDYAVIHRQRK